jgi:hypothetical protein
MYKMGYLQLSFGTVCQGISSVTTQSTTTIGLILGLLMHVIPCHTRYPQPTFIPQFTFMPSYIEEMSTRSHSPDWVFIEDT